MNNELMTVNEVEQLLNSNTDQILLDELAETIINQIIKKQKDIRKRIKNAEQTNKEASYWNEKEIGFFKRTFTRAVEKQQNKINKLTISTNHQIIELQAEENELIQKSIEYTKLNGFLSDSMARYLSDILLKGYEDNKGNIVQVSEEQRKMLMGMKNSAIHFAAEKIKVEKLVKNTEKHEDEIRELQDKYKEKDELDNEQDKKIKSNELAIQTLKREKDKLDSEQDEKIKNNAMAIQTLKQEKDKLDHEQDEKIKNNAMAIQTFKQEKDKLDNEQNERIQANTYAIQHLSERKDLTDKRQDELLAKLQLKTNIAITVAVIASLIAAVVLVLYFKK